MSIARKILMGSAGGKKSTYVDDVFSTYVYTGTGSARSINNGIDLAGEGGMVWSKIRNDTYSHALVDNVRGVSKVLRTERDNGELTASDMVTAFNSNGYSLGTDANGYANYNNTKNYVSWTFRKAPGFFDVVTYTGTGSARTVAHNLGSVPGMIIVKETSGGGGWWDVYHRGLNNGVTPQNYRIYLNDNGAEGAYTTHWNDTAPTVSNFTVGTNSSCNGNGATYVAYLFAGGSSTAATARSVSFDGNGEFLQCPNSSDGNPGTGDFTFECWIKPNSWTSMGDLFHVGSGGLMVGPYTTSYMSIRNGYGGGNVKLSTPSSVSMPPLGQWTHIAATRSGSTSRIFFNGIEVASGSDTTDYNGTSSILVGAGGDYFNGSISNARLIKGTALYTSSFKPPTEPLTNVTNTKLLWCNNSSVTGSTVTPGTITVNNTPTANADNPFDDVEGFKFGEGGDQNLIKTGSYKGNGNATGPVIDLDWEPQWIMVKNTSSSSNWLMFDCIRGLIVGINDVYLSANSTDAEATITGAAYIDPTSTGFKIKSTSGWINANNDEYIYIAIRRPDPLVQKPAEAGTDVFNIDFGNGSSTGPALDANFAVDALIKRAYASQSDCGIHFRLTGPRDLRTNTTDVEGNDANGGVFDYMKGVSKNQSTSIWGLMWKRHAGLDVVTYTGLGGTLAAYAHSLGKIPEMIWVKRRDGTNPWSVYHKGLNGGSNPEGYGAQLNTNAAEAASSSRWGNTAPTSTYFFAGGNTGTNNSNSTYIAMLFASVDGISKCGYYTGTGVSGKSETTGFTPRMILIKRSDSTSNWNMWDSVRGWSNGLYLNDVDSNQNIPWVSTTATGFTLPTTNVNVNASGGKYIYYAHA